MVEDDNDDDSVWAAEATKGRLEGDALTVFALTDDLVLGPAAPAPASARSGIGGNGGGGKPVFRVDSSGGVRRDAAAGRGSVAAAGWIKEADGGGRPDPHFAGSCTVTRRPINVAAAALREGGSGDGPGPREGLSKMLIYPEAPTTSAVGGGKVIALPDSD